MPYGPEAEAQALQPLRARFQPVSLMGFQAGGEASLSIFEKDRIHYSMFDVHQFLFRSDRALAAKAALIKNYRSVWVF